MLDEDQNAVELENDEFVTVAIVRAEFGALMREVFDDYIVDLSE